MPRLEIYLLGAPRIVLDGAPLSLERRKATALLAYLALSRAPVSREALADLFWPDYDASSAFSYLRRALWEVKALLGEGWLDAGREQVSLKSDTDLWVDVLAFQELSERCKAGDASAECLAALEKAVSLYRGDFMAGFSLPDSPDFEQWQLDQAASLRQALAGALEKCSRGFEEAGNPDKALIYAQRWLALDSLEEGAHRQLMRLYARQGQRAAALRQYEACVQILQKELGAEPQLETRALAEQIRHSEIEPAPAAAAPRLLTPSTARPGGTGRPRPELPLQLTPFVGRVQELEEIGVFLRNPAVRLLTLVGPGGMGKTRLAIESARQEMASFADGACFVPLAGTSVAANIPAAIAQALNMALEAGNLSQRVCDALHDRQILLILDNFEHLINEEGIEIVQTLLECSEAIRIMVTSRERLNIGGEQLYPVTGMRVPPASETPVDIAEIEKFSSVKLFVQSARRLRPSFRLDGNTLGPVIELCRAVQGMPLAIELAAGWIGLLSPAEIVGEVHRGLDLLETSRRDAPERQRSIRAVFDTSWSLLTPPQAQKLNALAVFRGSFTRQAAQAVAGTSIADLNALESKSLLQVRAQPSQGRYDIHPLLEEYAIERLNQNQAAWVVAHDRHAAYYFNLLTALGKNLVGARQAETLMELEAEFEDFNAAWKWAVEHQQFEAIDRGLLTLYLIYNIGNINADALLDSAIQALESVTRGDRQRILLLAKLLCLRANSASDFSTALPTNYYLKALDLVRSIHGEREIGVFFAFIAGGYAFRVDSEKGLELVQEALGCLRQENEPWSMANATRLLGEVFFSMGRREEAIAAFTESASIARSSGDKVSLAYILLDLGRAHLTLLDSSRAFQIYEESLQIAGETGQKNVSASVYQQMGDTCAERGDYDQALAYYDQAEAIFAELSNRSAICPLLSFKSIAIARHGDTSQARQVRLKSLAIAAEINDRNALMWDKWELGEIERLEGHFETARRLYEESRLLFEENRLFSLLPFYHRGLGLIDLAQGRLEEAREKLSLSIEEARQGEYAWAESYALGCLGFADLALGNVEAARYDFQDALKKAIEVDNHGLTLLALAGFAGVHAARDETTKAVRLAAFVVGQKATWEETRGMAKQVMEKAGAALDAVARAAAVEQGNEITLESTLAEYREG